MMTESVLKAIMAERGYLVTNSCLELKIGQCLDSLKAVCHTPLFDITEQPFFVICPTTRQDADEHVRCSIRHGGPPLEGGWRYHRFYRIGTD